jgi:ankyrin repeat protein
VCGGESNTQDGGTALIGAAAFGFADCVRLLIDAGANKNIRNNVRVEGRRLVLFLLPLLDF